MRVGRKPNRNDKEVIKELKLLGILKNEANITGNTFPIYKFAFVDKVINENKFKLLDIPVICEQLGIRKSSFYNWVDRGKPKHYNWNESLAQKILEKQNPNRTLGARKICWLLEQEGIYIGYKKVIRYMKYLKIIWDEETARAKSQGKLKSKRKFTGWHRTGLKNVFHYTTRKISTSQYNQPINKKGISKYKKSLCWIGCYIHNKWHVILRNNPEYRIQKHDDVNGDNNEVKYQEALNAYDTALENKVLPFEILASDVMFLTRKNRKEVLLIFVIIDIATRKVIDYCFTINGNDNIPEYLKLMGKSIKDKHVIIFHSDNGVEYTDERTKTLFSKHKVQQSFTDKNSSYQNGTVEGFWSQLSRHIYLRKLLDEKATNEEIKEHVNKFIILYNKRIDDNLKKIGFKYEYDELINLKHRWYIEKFMKLAELFCFL